MEVGRRRAIISDAICAGVPPLPNPLRKRYTPPVDTNNEPEKENPKSDGTPRHTDLCNGIRPEFSELSADEDLRLAGLGNTPGPGDQLQMPARAMNFGDKTGILAGYFKVLMQANGKSLMEAYRMSNDKMTLDSIFEGLGLAAKWEARGENRVLGLFKQGYTVEEVERMLAGRETAEVSPGDQLLPATSQT